MATRRKILYSIIIVILIAIAGFTLWAYTPQGPAQRAIDSLRDSETVIVTIDKWITFQPEQQSTTGFIFYPGGHVDPRSYAPLAHDIALEGYLVVIAKMPFNLAVLNKNAAVKIIEENPEITNWLIGGHSLGGAMAASLVYDMPQLFKGLVLLAAYPPKNNDLSGLEIYAVTIYASNDQLATPDEIEKSLGLLPADTVKVLIPGGNHAQFGYYGVQMGDGEATITLGSQQNITATKIIEQLKTIEHPTS